MTLGGYFLGDEEQKASDTLANIFLNAGNRVRGMQSPLSGDYRRPLLDRCVIFHHVFSRGSNVFRNTFVRGIQRFLFGSYFPHPVVL